MKKLKRALRIIVCAVLGTHSPTLRRRIRVSDIWKHPNWN